MPENKLQQMAAEAIGNYISASEQKIGTITTGYQIVKLLGDKECETMPRNYAEAIVEALAIIAQPSVHKKFCEEMHEVTFFFFLDFLKRAQYFCNLFADGDAYQAWLLNLAVENHVFGDDEHISLIDQYVLKSKAFNIQNP